jgi:cytochrome c556
MKFWTWTIIILLSVTAIGVSSFFIMQTFFDSNSPLQTKNERSVVKEASAEVEESFNTEKVNTPVNEEVVALADGTSGHTFISNWHDFYNETLGWGRLETTSYEEQKEAALSILKEMKDIKVSDDKIAQDMEDITANAQVIAEKDDRAAMRNLHRYFHDLDIYFNGYNYNQTFGITEFRGN